ncbi:MAG: hypothetical protein HQ503_11210 [Rhodospirillales bacterium]|nr:hypothetical protein [Rhodospirillales bacterium]
MNKSPDADHAWPKTAGGTVDWEVVFEDPENGLLSLIAQASSPTALRECAILIIEKLYTRKDDPPEIERFIREISELIPNDLPPSNLPEISDAVTGLLRQIKDQKINIAAKFEENKSDHAPGGEPQITGKNRRISDRPPDIKLPSRKAKKSKQLYLYAALGLSAAVVGLITIIFTDSHFRPPKENQTTILIRQMKDAAGGNTPETHIFGGALHVGRTAGKTTITAIGVPLNACFDVVWGLVNRGSVIINGHFPRKLSPQIIRELCAKNGKKADLTFLPKK